MQNYQNYERTIYPGIEESLSKIVNKISDHSVVLDVGCGSGMLGLYLSQEKGCVVDGVDLDKDAIEICRPIYRFTAVRNLESELLTDVFKAKEYDYIVVADVVEHLINPDHLLSELKQLIKPNGTIIFSVPNITHIAIGFELLFGYFNYSNNGLLDSTHLRFYSRESLLSKLKAFGLYAWEVDTVQKEIAETEFTDHISTLFPAHWKNALISLREDALTYQWLISTKIHPNVIQNNINLTLATRRPPLVFTSELFWADKDHPSLTEQNKLIGHRVSKSNELTIVDFYFSECGSLNGLKQIRIDPVSDQKPFVIVNAEILTPENTVIWKWEPQAICHEVHGVCLVECFNAGGCLFQATNDDPQWYPAIDEEILERVTDGWIFRLSLKVDESLFNYFNSELNGQLQSILELDSKITDLHQVVAERDGQIVNLYQVVAERDGQIAFLVAERANILASTSWKITKPLRFIRRGLEQKLYRPIRKKLSDALRKAWLRLPLAIKYKRLLKHGLFKRLPFVFGWSQAYRSWTAMNAPSETYSELIENQGTFFTPELTRNTYVPLLQAPPLKEMPVKLIAFYLPQFHAIAENNAWWGEGFTEWSNVKPAQPQFEGHYQPRIPGEFGYYDLLDPSVQSKQIELAKLYGIGGFCFYSYWFGGKRLLEKPVENYLKDRSLDLPFCLCWANENWSRRWDGLDSEILIAQKHSPEDDLGFIQHVAQYMRDGRYIRIDGKPLLLVYRPSLLPSAKETAERWRRWCQQNGIGDIFLAYTQSFEMVEPEKYGFDAAIEFPPNNSSPPNITEKVKPLNKRFSCTVYDWRVFVERSRNYQKPDYKLFRGVCPSWDNTARRKNRGTVFSNSSPQGYQEWLTNAITETCTRVGNKEERLIFVNAWNEWAEGAHLEPDQRYGYAYLEATRLALIRSSLILRESSFANAQIVAIVIHAFYDDVFVEILEYLKNIVDLPMKLYVTTTPEKEGVIHKLLVSQSCNFLLRVVENRGRDILPFMKIMPEVISAGHDFFVKVHTKKSPHRKDGNEWRKDLYDKLIDGATMKEGIRILKENPSIGIFCPDGHFVEMSYFWGSNAERVIHLASRMGVEPNALPGLNFIAGSMFIARVDAIIPLLNLAIDDSDFELELGQTDGTLAHAIERLFAVSAHSIELCTVCPSNAALTEYEFAKH